MNISNKIKQIISRGCLEGQNQFEKRRGYFFNIILLFIVFASLIMVFVAQSWHSKLLNITGITVFLILYYVHGLKPKNSAVLFGLAYQVFIFIHSSILDVGGHVEYGALAMTIILPIFYRRKAAFYFMLSNMIIFYYPYMVLDAYESYFKLSYVFSIGLFFTVRVFVKESEKYELNLMNKQNELQELNKEKNHLIQVVAHDLKSPLNQVDGLISLIKLSTKEAEKKEYLDKIINSTQHMSSMITRILDIEKIEKREPIKLQKLDLIPIIKNVIESFRELAANKHIEIEQLISNSNLWINGNPHYLYQIFHNIVSNALKFSPNGKEIKVIVEQHNEIAIIKVIDQGPGISSTDQEKLFKKFQKLTAKPTANEDSTGLGLALTKSFVNSLSGNIYCESKLNEGATFVVEFSSYSASTLN